MANRYDVYQETNIQWIDNVPKHWELKRGKSIFYTSKVLNKGGKWKNVLSLTKKGVIRNNIDNPIGLAPKSYDTYQLFEKDDLVFKLIDLENIATSRVGLVWEQGVMSPAYIRLQKREDDGNIKYFYYQYYSWYLQCVYNNLGAGVRQTITADELLNLTIPVPPTPEQDKIVKYLDWKTSEIEKFIHQKKKQIKRLDELKKRQIDDVVTTGLNCAIAKKISKAVWMGEVPESWKEYRLKNLFTEINVRSEKGLEPHLSMSQKKGLVTDDEDIERRLLSESYAGAKLCEKDDLVLNRLKAHLGVFALSPMLGIVSPDYTVLRLDKKKVIPKYLEYLLKSNACRGELVKRVRGIVEGFWRLYTEDLGAIPVCIPSIDEQQAILDEIIVIDQKIASMIKAVNAEIELLQELRTKIIADVVTGQIDVRDVIIPDYDRETIDEEDEIDTDSEDSDDESEE